MNPADPRNAFIVEDIRNNYDKHARIMACALASPTSPEKAEMLERFQHAVDALRELF